MSSAKKPEQFDLFGPKRDAPVPVPDDVDVPVFDDEELPPLELLDAPQQPIVAAQQRIYRVEEIVRLASRALEARFGDVIVEGEISNLKTPGHCYFTLKDAEAQLPAVMFRTAAQRLKFRLTDGLKVR